MSGMTAARYLLAGQVAGGFMQLGGGIAGYRSAQDYASMAREAKDMAVNKFMKRTVEIVGTQKMKAIAGGVSPWHGSPRQRQMETWTQASSNAALLALGYEIQAQNAEAQGKATAIQGAANAAWTFLSAGHTAHTAGLFKHGILKGILGIPGKTPKSVPVTPGKAPPKVPTVMTGTPRAPMPPRGTLDPGAFATGTWGTS